MFNWFKKAAVRADTPPPVTEDAQALQEQGLALQQQGRFAEAEHQYRAVLRQRPNEAIVHVRLAETLAGQGRQADALVSFRQAASLDPALGIAHFNRGMLYQEQGRFVEAEQHYGQVKANDPLITGALFNLAGIQSGQGRLPQAEANLRRVLELAPDLPVALLTLGRVLIGQGKGKDAQAPLRRVLALDPGQHDAYGDLLNILLGVGELTQAEALCREQLLAKPDNAYYHYNLGVVLGNEGRPADAQQCYEKALALMPELSQARNNLISMQIEQSLFDAAEASCRQASLAHPGDPVFLDRLGALLLHQSRLDEAESCYKASLERQAQSFDALFGLAKVEAAQGRHAQAEATLYKAIRLKPESAEAQCDLASALYRQNRYGDALPAYLRAIQLNPGLAPAHDGAGSVLQLQGQLLAAEQHYRRALALQPASVTAHNNLGLLLKEQCKPAEAADCFRRALEIDPGFTEAHSNMLFCMSQDESITPAALLLEHKRFGDRVEGALRDHWQAHANQRDPNRPLVVGFVSADMRAHALANFIEPIFEQLSRYPSLVLHVYYNHMVHDQVTKRLRSFIAHWHDIVGVPDAALAQQIRADGIDILVDLSGHTGLQRLQTFAHKPAPIQLSWMGYPGTTGMQAMDYYVGDQYLLPPGTAEEQFSESLIRLPANAPFIPSSAAPPVSALPALAKGYVTFGSFNRVGKINPRVVAAWAALLHAVPTAHLLLGAMPADGAAAAITGWFADAGVSPDRLSMHPRSDMASYLALHQQVDICLDTFPYGGGTTTLNAIWMGVPTLTVTGSTIASRCGATILGLIGLPEFVAVDVDDFVRKGVAAASDLAALAALRAGMRSRFAASPTGQPAEVARSFDTALRAIWQRWCAGLPPVSIDATSSEAHPAASTPAH